MGLDGQIRKKQSLQSKGNAMNFFYLQLNKLLQYYRSKYLPLELSDTLKSMISEITMLDVGGAEGAPSQFKWLNPITNLVSFEPDTRIYEQTLQSLKKSSFKSVKLITKALSGKDKNRNLYLTQKQQCSSLLKPNMKILNNFPLASRFSIVKTESLECSTLNELQSETGHIDFIKIDTQGSELEILKEASYVLTTCLAIELETEFCPLYEGQPLFSEIELFLRDKGFQVIDIDVYRWLNETSPSKATMDSQLIGKGQTVFANSLFIKSWDTNHRYQKDELLKLILILLSYKHISLCYHFLNLGLQENVLNKEQYDILVQEIIDQTQRPIYYHFFKIVGFFKWKRKQTYYFSA